MVSVEAARMNREISGAGDEIKHWLRQSDAVCRLNSCRLHLTPLNLV